MIGKLFVLACAALGASASLVEKDVTVAQAGNTLTISGVSTNEVIIIQTNAGGGADWSNVNPAIATGGQTHIVTVGGSTLTYNPSSITAAVGDIIEFHYLMKNHSTTQSSFNTPCISSHQFDTGFVPNPTGMNPPPMIRVQVNTTTPTWFHCRQTGHCGKGMVFSVNPLATGKTSDAFRSLAIAQNGTASASGAIAPPPAATSSTASSATSSSAAASSSVASGTGSTNAQGECSCSCLCGAGSFGELTTSGVGKFGGFGGMLTPGPNGA